MARERAAAAAAARRIWKARPQRVPQQQQAKKNVRGLNENYGRELMELHTLAWTAGYTQRM